MARTSELRDVWHDDEGADERALVARFGLLHLIVAQDDVNAAVHISTCHMIKSLHAEWACDDEIVCG